MRGKGRASMTSGNDDLLGGSFTQGSDVHRHFSIKFIEKPKQPFLRKQRIAPIHQVGNFRLFDLQQLAYLALFDLPAFKDHPHGISKLGPDQ